MPTLSNIYPPNCTDTELGELLIVAEKFRPHSDKLANWIAAFVEFEQARRHAEKLADPIDVEVPKLNAARWTDGELLDAAWASFNAYRVMKHHKAAGMLLETVHNVLLLWTRHRFRNPADADCFGSEKTAGASNE